MSHADDLQAVSVDEALIDVTTTVNQLRSQVTTTHLTTLPKILQKRYEPKYNRLQVAKVNFSLTSKQGIKLTLSFYYYLKVSIGILHNILLACLAIHHHKPAGSYHLISSEIPKFLAPLGIADLHGFGWSSKQKTTTKLGVSTLGELAKKGKDSLIGGALGKSTGEILHNAVRGIDDKKLDSDNPEYPFLVKSIFFFLILFEVVL